MHPLRVSLFALLFLAVLGFSQEAEAEREYPNNWTHRPLIEDFTSLSCYYCMSYNAQAINQLVEDSENDPSNPYNIVSFHQTNGGEGDDPFHTQDSRSRMRDHYGQTGTPNVQFDGNYRYVGGGGDSNYQDYVNAISESGLREGEGNDKSFKFVSLDVWFEYTTEVDEDNNDTISSFFIVTVEVTFQDESDCEDTILASCILEGELVVYFVEDNVEGYSSYHGDMVNSRMVFRTFESTDLELTKGDSMNWEFRWDIPTNQIDGDGVEGPIKVPINPANIIPIAVVYDKDDTDSGNDQDSNGDDTYPTPRAVQSATPKSTAYDNGLRYSDIIDTQLTQFDKETIYIEVTFSDDVDISTAVLSYRIDDGPWLFSSMDISDYNQVAKAQILANGKVLTYHIFSHNADRNFNVSKAYDYKILYSNLRIDDAEIFVDICNIDNLTFQAVNEGNFDDTIVASISNIDWLSEYGFEVVLPAEQYFLKVGERHQINLTIYSSNVKDIEKDYVIIFNISTVLEGWESSAEVSTEMKFTNCNVNDKEDKEEVKIPGWPTAIVGQDISISPGDTVQFNGAGTDEDGSITKYEWDFDGDGVFEWSSEENGVTTFIYNTAGTYTATLRVTDNDAKTDTDSLTVTVKSPDEEDEGIPGFGFAAAILSVGLIARTRRD